MNKIKALSIKDQSRIIVISDIHGELELFKELLDKVQFSKEDYLIINGDLCEKGANSTGVVRYVIELAAQNPRVHVIEGNCDALVEELLNENPQLINYLCARKHSIMNEWLEQIEFSITIDTSIQEVKEQLLTHFSEEIMWLSELPTAIETDQYIFVHAGLEDIDNWKDTDRDNAISIPEFLYKSHRANKNVIVGHWPVGNYSSKILSNNPIIDLEKKIIAIDGGNNVKNSGQLNAFIIQPSSSENIYSYTYVDHFRKINAVIDFEADTVMTGSISYVDYRILPLERGDYFTLCQQVETGEQVYVKNEYIHQTDNGFEVKKEVSCAQINVKKGDIISVLDDTCAGYALIKNNGIVGWVPKEVLQ
ncbi:metallophosphoesterase [Bacillus sp. FJAT-49736]|uniref:metallophosphoesterase n=1 Tax=Bacillus sp. FJAT-49736 TaxID=2833582 RepID=UPI001BC96C2F|nr:metallophosphoesterase [Bacillus sp. FJAT-49736]MBS4174821.1 metallophosphoesterase [Bacillus sp. FJAT-49736]MBS4175522.1 metallophosphoesterase [Bacillus sp. FJAT-49736]